MFGEFIDYKNTDVLLMDPCFSRLYDFDIDSELICSDLIVDTFADGYYYAIKGTYEEMKGQLDDIAEKAEQLSVGGVSVESARIGVYDYHEAVAEQPQLKERIEKEEFFAVVIKDFTGTIKSVFDDDGNVFVVGTSVDGNHDFFTVAFYE